MKVLRKSKWMAVLCVFGLVWASMSPLPVVAAEGVLSAVVDLSAPGTRVLPSADFRPIQLRGLTIDPTDPLRFNFLIEPGSTAGAESALRAEADKLIKYFLAALAIPEEEMWFNLSPHESDRVIPGGLGRTAMGREMLAQDYLLKQLTASLFHPEEETGRKFWERVYRRAQFTFGTTDIPTNTFNKVWIVPEEATVYVNGQSVFVADCRLKVLLEEDYLSGTHHSAEKADDPGELRGTAAQLVREIVLPEIEREINHGQTFAGLRQIFHAVVLAEWYKQNLKESLLGQAYAGRNRISGIDENDPQVNVEIYERYLAAMRKGVFDFIREDVDPVTRKTMPRRYVSGGVDARVQVRTDESMLSRRTFIRSLSGLFVVTAALVTGVPVPALAQDPPQVVRLVAPGVEDRAQDLRWSDGTRMLGEEQPGIAYYHSPSNTYLPLLDESEGGQGEAARIFGAGFRVVKVYTTTRENMEELERVSQRIYEQYGLRTIAVFSPQINGALVADNPDVLQTAIADYVQLLGRHPWIGIQLGNEDHYYLRGELLAGDNGIPMTKDQYYRRYDEIAGQIRTRLVAAAPGAEAAKPILLGQGVRIGHRDDWREQLDETINFVRGMQNISGLAVNAYLEPAESYGTVLTYLRQQTGMTIVVGEFGRSRRNLSPALQQTFNQRSWEAVLQAIRSGHAAGGILFAWSDKVPGDEAEGATENFRLYDREFGIRYQGGINAPTYFEQRVVAPVAIPREQYNTLDGQFWRGVQFPRLNRNFLIWYTQQMQGIAARQQREKTALIESAAAEDRLLTDDEVNQFHALNFMGEGLYHLAVLAIYEGNINEVERIYDQMYVYYSGAQMQFGPRNFWVPYRNITAQLELIRDTTSDEELRERLRLILAARPTADRPPTYQDIRPDNSMFADAVVARLAQGLAIATLSYTNVLGDGLGAGRLAGHFHKPDTLPTYEHFIQNAAMGPLDGSEGTSMGFGLHFTDQLYWSRQRVYGVPFIRDAGVNWGLAYYLGHVIKRENFGIELRGRVQANHFDSEPGWVNKTIQEVERKLSRLPERFGENRPEEGMHLYDIDDNGRLVEIAGKEVGEWDYQAEFSARLGGILPGIGASYSIRGIFAPKLTDDPLDVTQVSIGGAFYKPIGDRFTLVAGTGYTAAIDPDQFNLVGIEDGFRTVEFGAYYSFGPRASIGLRYFEQENPLSLSGERMEDLAMINLSFRYVFGAEKKDTFSFSGAEGVEDEDFSSNRAPMPDVGVSLHYEFQLKDRNMRKRQEDPSTLQEYAVEDYDLTKDEAALAGEAPGGIDFHPGHMTLTTEGQGLRFPVPAVTPAEPIDNLVPVIINITPVTNLPLLLGVHDTPGPQLSRAP